MSMTQTSHSKCLIFSPGREQQGNPADCVGWREEELDGGRKERPGCQNCPLKKALPKESSARKKKKKGGIKSKYIVDFGKSIAFMCCVFQEMFPFSEQKWGTKETFRNFCLSCSGAAGRLWASGSHKSSPEMRLKYAPLHITYGMENAYGTPRSAVHQHCSCHRCKIKPMQV